MAQQPTTTNQPQNAAPDLRRRGKFTRLAGLVLKTKKRSVYRGFNMEDGVEVLWHTLNIEGLSTEERSTLLQKFERISLLRHSNVVTVLTYWMDEDNDKHVHFITELMSSGSLAEFMNRPGKLSRKTLTRWCSQILRGLSYLHSLDPPIVHKNIRCQNLYFNGNTGEVKIACWDLAMKMRGLQNDIGTDTPEFMAPEMFEDDSQTKLVDIYSFGMCILQLSTKKKPYAECKSTKKVFEKIEKGIYPASLENVDDVDLKAMVTLCLSPRERRPTAQDILQRFDYLLAVNRPQQRRVPKNPTCIQIETEGHHVMLSHKVTHSALMSLRMRSQGRERIVHFPYHVSTDTPSSVATDMRRELKLPDSLVSTVEAALLEFDSTYVSNLTRPAGGAPDPILKRMP